MITTLIFDFGGVLTTTKFFPRLAEEFGRTYHLDPELVRKRLYKHEHASLLGQESLEEFWEKTCKDLGIPLDALIHAFMSYELSPKMFAYLRMLKDKYLLVLHSDNFALRVAMIRKDPHFEIFDRMYFSNEIGMPKTTEEAFRHVLTDLGKRPEECVF
ncbi:MAG TPA: HAD family hydrolase, partial [Candidatus Nanoarchaeia archaeon]|nr:HAD family hydrolase [Candidatus Nanoarchaeia archaeon]